jgi:hypothetical protein
MGPKAGLVAVEKRKIFSPAGNRILAVQLVAISAELSWLPLFVDYLAFLMLYAIQKINTFTVKLRCYSEMTR